MRSFRVNASKSEPGISQVWLHSELQSWKLLKACLVEYGLRKVYHLRIFQWTFLFGRTEVLIDRLSLVNFEKDDACTAPVLSG